MPFINLLIYSVAFLFIWLGSGLIVSSVDKFSKKLNLSPFALSFIVLGILTSTPEFAVGLQSVAENNAEIFVGNLLGGIPVLFLFVIPILAVLGNGINLKNDLDKNTLLVSLGVILAPSLLVLDKKVTNIEGILMIFLYFCLTVLIQKRHGLFDGSNKKLLDVKAYSYKDMAKVLIGVAIVFISSNLIVDKTFYFSNLLSISPFYISLIGISLGTNLPELSIAIRAVISGKKDVAIGDYLGSAASNTLLFGIFTLLISGEVLTVNNFLMTFMFIASALILFFFFSRSKNSISRKEGAILFAVYVVFVAFELLL